MSTLNSLKLCSIGPDHLRNHVAAVIALNNNASWGNMSLSLSNLCPLLAVVDFTDLFSGRPALKGATKARWVTKASIVIVVLVVVVGHLLRFI